MILKISAKKVIFLVSRGKNQVLPLLTPRKILKKSPNGPPWKKSFRCPCQQVTLKSKNVHVITDAENAFFALKH